LFTFFTPVRVKQVKKVKERSESPAFAQWRVKEVKEVKPALRSPRLPCGTGRGGGK
jgi:hypothetical protein